MTQRNGKLERWHKSLKSECIRPGTPLSLEDARRLVAGYVGYSNTVRLHSAIGYVAPADKLAGREPVIFAERDRKLNEARWCRQARRAATREMIAAATVEGDNVDQPAKWTRALEASNQSGIAGLECDEWSQGRMVECCVPTPFGAFPYASENANARRRRAREARGLTVQLRLNHCRGSLTMTRYWLKRTENSPFEGPLSAAELKRLAARGQITKQSFVSADNTNWTPAPQVKGLLLARRATPEADRGEPPSAAPVVQEAGASPYAVHLETKACPYCGELILAVAIKCKHCGERFDIAKGPMTQVSACQSCGVHFGERIPYNFYDRFRICRRCRNSLINRRAGAYLLDVLFMWVAALLLGAIIGFLAVAGGSTERDIEDMSALFGCFGWLIAITYMLLKDGMFHGQSPGKAICGIRVIDINSGAPCGLGDSAKRNLPLLIPFVPLIVAFQINGGDSSRWGDGWAETAVVRKAWARLVKPR